MLDFIIGSSYKRSEIHDAWGGQRQGGISTPKDHPVIFLFSTARGSEFGYEDGRHKDGFFHYSGEGQEGDIQETRGNANFEFLALSNDGYVVTYGIRNCEIFGIY